MVESVTKLSSNHVPFTMEELFLRSSKMDAMSKHLLTIYSIAVGLKAKVIVDLGLGQTTGTLRAASRITGGTVYSCDVDEKRYAPLLGEQDDRWKLYLGTSSSFIPTVPGPIDFVMHDGAHDYVNVRKDLEALIPKMKQFGIICVHDTQQIDLSHDMLAAIKDAASTFSVSMTNLPFGAGLAILRVESSANSSIDPATGVLPDGRPETVLKEFPCTPTSDIRVSTVGALARAAKVVCWGLLRKAGLR